MEHIDEFNYIKTLILKERAAAIQAAHSSQLSLYWQIGAFVHYQLSGSHWGARVVDSLAEWLKKEDPSLRGFDRRSIYRMREFYNTWSQIDWSQVDTKKKIVGAVTPQLLSIDNQPVIKMGSVSPQLPSPPRLLTRLTWSHHIEILKRTKTLDESIFYFLLAVKESYTVRELSRQIATSYYQRHILGKQQLNFHPASDDAQHVFIDKYLFEFLNLQEPFSEGDLQRALIGNLKNFLLELGKDFLFIGQEYRVQVGMHDYYVDLLLYHRELRCLVAFELKVDEFKPEYLGKLNFYLEALDRDVKKPHENPTIGILLCAQKDSEVVEFAMNRNISPALIAEYTTKVIDKRLLEKMLHQWAGEVPDKEE